MWYFTWILGLGVALAFGIINAIWYELVEGEPDAQTLPPLFKGERHRDSE